MLSPDLISTVKSNPSPPRSKVGGSAEIKAGGPTKDRHKTHFHTTVDTFPQGDSHLILPQFYPSCIFYHNNGVSRRSPPESIDPMIHASSAYRLWRSSPEGR